MMKDIIRQHLIPTPRPSDLRALDVVDNNKPLPFEDSPTFSTLLASTSSYGEVVFRNVEDNGKSYFVVGIKGARGQNGRADWARVMSWGRSTTGGGTGGVIQIDHLLFPYQAPWWIAYGAPTVVGVGGILLICALFYWISIVWRRDHTEATYEPVGGFGRDDDDN